MIFKLNFLEWLGVILGILYSLLVSLNINLEFFGFILMLIAAGSLGIWAHIGNHRGILFLQIIHSLIAIVGMIRWF